MGRGVQFAVVFAAVALIACFTDATPHPDPVNSLEQVSKGQAVLGAQATTQQGSAAPEQQHLPKPHTYRALKQQGNEANGGDDGSAEDEQFVVMVVEANGAQATDPNAPASPGEESTDDSNEADAAEEDAVEEYEVTDGSADADEDDTGDTTSEAVSGASRAAIDTEASAATDGTEGTQGPDQQTGQEAQNEGQEQEDAALSSNDSPNPLPAPEPAPKPAAQPVPSPAPQPTLQPTTPQRLDSADMEPESQDFGRNEGDALDVAEFNLMHPEDQGGGAEAAATVSTDSSQDSTTAAEAGAEASSSSTLPAFDEAYDNRRRKELTPEFHAEARPSSSVPPPSGKTPKTAGTMKTATKHKSKAAGLSGKQGQWEDRAALQQEYENYRKGGALSADDPGLQAQGAELDGGTEEEEEADADSSAEGAEGEPLIADYEGADSGSYMPEDEYAAAEPKPAQTHTKPLTAHKGKPTKRQVQPTAQHRPPAMLQATPQSAAPTLQLAKPPVPKQQPSKLEQQLEYLDYSDYESLLPVDDVDAEDDSVQQPQAARTPSTKKAAKSISPSAAQAESPGADPLTADTDMAEQADAPATTQSTRNAAAKPVEQLQGKSTRLQKQQQSQRPSPPLVKPALTAPGLKVDTADNTRMAGNRPKGLSQGSTTQQQLEAQENQDFEGDASDAAGYSAPPPKAQSKGVTKRANIGSTDTRKKQAAAGSTEADEPVKVIALGSLGSLGQPKPLMGLSAKLQQPQTGFSQQPAAMPRLQKAMLGSGLNNLASQPRVQQQQNTAGGPRLSFSKRVSTGQPTLQQPGSMSQQQQPDDQESQAMLRTGLGNLVSQPSVQQQQNTAGGQRFSFSKLVSTGQPTPQQPGGMTQQQQQQPGDQESQAMLRTGLGNLVSQPPIQQQQNTAGGPRFGFSKRVSTGQPTPQQPGGMAQQQQQPGDHEYEDYDGEALDTEDGQQQLRHAFGSVPFMQVPGSDALMEEHPDSEPIADLVGGTNSNDTGTAPGEQHKQALSSVRNYNSSVRNYNNYNSSDYGGWGSYGGDYGGYDDGYYGGYDGYDNYGGYDGYDDGYGSSGGYGGYGYGDYGHGGYGHGGYRPDLQENIAYHWPGAVHCGTCCPHTNTTNETQAMILQPGEVVTATITCMIANDTSDLYSAKCKYDQHSNLQIGGFCKLECQNPADYLLVTPVETGWQGGCSGTEGAQTTCSYIAVNSPDGQDHPPYAGTCTITAVAKCCKQLCRHKHRPPKKHYGYGEPKKHYSRPHGKKVTDVLQDWYQDPGVGTILPIKVFKGGQAYGKKQGGYDDREGQDYYGSNKPEGPSKYPSRSGGYSKGPGKQQYKGDSRSYDHTNTHEESHSYAGSKDDSQHRYKGGQGGYHGQKAGSGGGRRWRGSEKDDSHGPESHDQSGSQQYDETDQGYDEPSPPPRKRVQARRAYMAGPDAT